MAYTEEVLVGAVYPASAAPQTPLVFTGAPAVYSIYNVMSRIKVSRIMVKISTLVAASTAAPRVQFFRRPTPGSTTGEVLIGTLIIPTGSAVGKVVYKDVQSVSVNVGEDLVIKLSVTATDAGTAAGQAYAGFVAMLDPEDARSEANMVASA